MHMSFIVVINAECMIDVCCYCCLPLVWLILELVEVEAEVEAEVDKNNMKELLRHHHHHPLLLIRLSCILWSQIC